MSRLRVINLGLPKSGTTTLGEALKRAGLTVADWRVRRGQSRGDALRGMAVGELMYRGWFELGDPLGLMDEFDAVSQVDIVRDGLNLWPQTDWGLLSAIRARHPGARFVLTARDPAKIADSMARWSNLVRRLDQQTIPGLPAGFGGAEDQRLRWIEGHHAFCRQVFAGAADFLEIDVADPAAPAQLGAFLGRDLPWWGVANANETRPAADATELAR